MRKIFSVILILTMLLSVIVPQCILVSAADNELLVTKAITLQNDGKFESTEYLRVKNQKNATERVTFLQFDCSGYDMENIGDIDLCIYIYGNTTSAVGQLDENIAHLYWANYDISNVDATAKYATVFSTDTATEIGDNIISIPKVSKSNDGECYTFSVTDPVKQSIAGGKNSITFILKQDVVESTVTNYNKCGFDIYNTSNSDYAPKLKFYDYSVTLSQAGTKLKSGYNVVATDTKGIIENGGSVIFQSSTDGMTWTDVSDDVDTTDNVYTLTNAVAERYIRANVNDGKYLSNVLVSGANLTHPIGWNKSAEGVVEYTDAADKLYMTIPGYGSVNFVMLDRGDSKSLLLSKGLSAMPYYLDEENPETAYQIYDTADKYSIAYKINQSNYINTNILPTNLHSYILESEWETEAGIKDGKDAPNDRVTKSKIALLSSTEYNQYASKIGYKDSYGMRLRTPCDTGNRVEQILHSGKLQYAYSYESHYKLRPCFWLSDDLFKRVKIDVENTGANVISALKINEMLTEAEALALGYSKHELIKLGMKEGIALDASGMYKNNNTVYVNVSAYKDTPDEMDVAFYLAVYESDKEKLIYVEPYEKTIANGETKISFSAVVGNVADDCAVGLYAWDDDNRPVDGVLFDDIYSRIPDLVSGDIAADSDYFKYVGRWDDSNEGERVGHWVRPYVEFDVNTSSLILNFNSAGSANTFDIFVNGVCVNQVSTKQEAYDISSYLPEGLNNIKLVNKTNYEPFHFAGITVGDNSTIVRPVEKNPDILFIGDSISSDKVSYTYQMPNMIDADATVVARSGIALQDGRGSKVTLDDGTTVQIGMQTQFDVLESIGKGDTVYDYTDDNYDMVIINLGTNDAPASEEEKETFKVAYQSFIAKLRGYYPEASIVVVKPIRAFSKRNNDITNKTPSYWLGLAFSEMNQNGAFSGNNVYYCDTTELDLTYIDDNVHPDEAGHTDFSEFLINFLKENEL